MMEILKLIALPFKNGTAFTQAFYMVFFVALLGNAGPIFEIFNYFQNGNNPIYLDSLGRALVLFSPPIIGVSAANLLLGKHSKFLALASIATIIIILIASLILLFGNFVSLYAQIKYGLLMMAFSLFFWWIANGASEIFQEPRPEASVGGPIGGQLSGNTDDYEV